MTQIPPVETSLLNELKHKIDFKTKPVGSLGALEQIALKIGLIQNTLNPKLTKPSIIVFAGDHGVVKNNPVSPYPQEVTAQMVSNFLSGGAAISVFCKQNNINLKIVDAGVATDLETSPDLINAKIGNGTKDFTIENALTEIELRNAMSKGAEIVTKTSKEGCNSIGFGEMGIGNTSSAALLMHAYTKIPIEECTGKGTGLSSDGLELKITTLKKALKTLDKSTNPLQAFGGFEIAMITGAILQAASLKMTILIDGFIVTSALLAAHNINPTVLDYCIFSHNSEEKGHEKMLEFLNVTPLLNIGLRLGEGTGCALAYPLIQAAINFLNNMASFESAGVSNKE